MLINFRERLEARKYFFATLKARMSKVSTSLIIKFHCKKTIVIYTYVQLLYSMHIFSAQSIKLSVDKPSLHKIEKDIVKQSLRSITLEILSAF
jgi:hypothetical protein